MQLAQMITKFREGASDLDAAFGDGDIQTILNRHYRFAVQTELGDDYGRGILTLTTAASQSTYDEQTPGASNDFSRFISVAHGLSAYIRDGGQLFPLSVETDPFRFEALQAGDPAREGRPSAVLNYGRGLTFWPTPDEIYTISIPSVLAFSGDISDSTATARLKDDRIAMMIVYSGLMEYHHDTEDEVAYLRAEREWKRWKKRANRTAKGGASRRNQARSF